MFIRTIIHSLQILYPPSCYTRTLNIPLRFIHSFTSTLHCSRSRSWILPRATALTPHPSPQPSTPRLPLQIPTNLRTPIIIFLQVLHQLALRLFRSTLSLHVQDTPLQFPAKTYIGTTHPARAQSGKRLLTGTSTSRAKSGLVQIQGIAGPRSVPRKRVPGL
jgi:hypothetical protein